MNHDTQISRGRTPRSALRKCLAGVVLAFLMVTGAVVATAGPAQAIDTRCSLTPMTPYKSGSSVKYGATLSCGSWAGARMVSATAQRQGTGSWINLETSTSGTTSSSGLISRTTPSNTASCLAGNSTYRSNASGRDINAGTATAVSPGSTVSC